MQKGISGRENNVNSVLGQEKVKLLSGSESHCMGIGMVRDKA